MAPADEPLLPSLLDRLLDDAPDVSTEPAWSWTQSLGELKQSVMRDLEALLNTRQTRTELALGAAKAEIAQSVLTYGLPDLTSASAASPEARETLRLAVEAAIRRFEPRLIDVRVRANEMADAFDRTLRLTVEALLDMDPEPIPIAFDTVLESSTGAYQVKATA